MDERRAEQNDTYLSHGSVILDVVVVAAAVVVVVAKTVLFFATLINPLAINKSTHASNPLLLPLLFSPPPSSRQKTLLF